MQDKQNLFAWQNNSKTNWIKALNKYTQMHALLLCYYGVIVFYFLQHVAFVLG